MLIMGCFYTKHKNDFLSNDFYFFECVVCYNPMIPTFVITPCGHAQTCKECCQKIVKSYRGLQNFRKSRLICPTCRRRGDLTKLFLSYHRKTINSLPFSQ